MEYIKIVAKLNEFSEIAEHLLVATLGDLGCDSFQTNSEDGTVEGYINKEEFSPSLLESEELVSNPFFSGTFHWEEVESQNWNAEWEENHFTPIIIDNSVVICAPYHELDSNYSEHIIIDPNMSFGTGDHQTTSMIISLMRRRDYLNKSILDMGCGTGVLGIYAAQKGAKEVLGIDIDTWSVESTQRNITNNGVDSQMSAILGDASTLSDIKREEFDIIFANIHRNILIRDMESYIAVLAKGGEIMFSGFYSEDIDAITDRAVSLGLTFSEVSERDNWVVLAFKM